VREGLDDTFTIRRLGAPDWLAQSLSWTIAIESMISTVRLSLFRGKALVRRRLMGEPLRGSTMQLTRPSRRADNHVPRSVDCPRQLEEERC